MDIEEFTNDELKEEYFKVLRELQNRNINIMESLK
jgi:hypothetical protein